MTLWIIKKLFNGFIGKLSEEDRKKLSVAMSKLLMEAIQAYARSKM